MFGRRFFLRAMVAAPVAAKAAAGEVLAQTESALSGIAPLPRNTDVLVNAGLTAAFDDNKETWLKGMTLIAGGAFPEHVMKRLKREARNVSSLDPDLVSNRSMSLSTKVRLQRERNLVRGIDENREFAALALLKQTLPEHVRELW